MKVTDFPILLIEHDPAEIACIQEALGQANLVNPLRIVGDGRKAVAYLSGQGEYADRGSYPFPSLVLLDLTLPEMSGLEVLVWIRSQDNLKNLPVVLLTTSRMDQGEYEPAAGLGVTAHLSKPVGCDRLLEVMKSIGMYWMILDRTRPSSGEPGLPLQGSHVLIADRDADFLAGIGEALRRRTPSLVVDPAQNAAEALHRLTRSFLDAVVYARDIEEGVEFGFLDKVRAAAPDLPVFILCAESDEAFAARAALKGVTGVLLKQVRLDQFSDGLHAAIMKIRNLAAPPPPAAAEAASPPEPAEATPAETPVKVPGPGRRQDTDILGNQITFQETAWNLVKAAPKVEALDALIRVYWKPLYFFVRQRGFENEEAKDIIQEFLAGAIERGMIPKADPLRGRFRTFLLAALTNFLKDRRRSGGRLKRGGGHVPMSLDLELGEPKYSRAVRTGEPPEVIVDRAWAKGLLSQCILELVGKPSHLQAFDLQMQGVDYANIGRMTGLSETAAKTAVHRLRLKLRGILRTHLRLQNATEEEVGREVAEFATLLA